MKPSRNSAIEQSRNREIDQSPSISAVVLTFNEEKNLSACLESLRDVVGEVFVVDSGSTDDTLAIAEANGAHVFHHPFESHSRQWRWALETLPLEGEWVLALDADQSVSRELANEITVSRKRGLFDARDGFFLPRRQIFRGRWIRYGGYYPKYLLKLFRRLKVRVDPRDLVDHHFRIDGPTAKLRGDLIEDNRNELDISAWIEKHNRYAVLQARDDLAREPGEKGGAQRIFGTPDERVAWLKNRWRALPLFLRPFLYFVYRYVLRLGFLDGREGLVFHFLQGCWYRFLVDVNIDQQRQRMK